MTNLCEFIPGDLGQLTRTPETGYRRGGGRGDASRTGTGRRERRVVLRGALASARQPGRKWGPRRHTAPCPRKASRPSQLLRRRVILVLALGTSSVAASVRWSRAWQHPVTPRTPSPRRPRCPSGPPSSHGLRHHPPPPSPRRLCHPSGP